jgi:hypothetical protein
LNCTGGSTKVGGDFSFLLEVLTFDLSHSKEPISWKFEEYNYPTVEAEQVPNFHGAAIE